LLHGSHQQKPKSETVVGLKKRKGNSHEVSQELSARAVKRPAVQANSIALGDCGLKYITT